VFAQVDLRQVDDLERGNLGDRFVDRAASVDTDAAIGAVVVVRDRGPAISTPASFDASNRRG
jgi:hypothetical protein